MKSPAGQNESHRGVRGYACKPCAKRKVRCDRLEPCSNCQRRPEDTCVYVAPHPHRRKDKDQDANRRRSQSNASPSQGRLIVEQSRNKSRYIDETMWTSLNNVVSNDENMLTDTSDDDTHAGSTQVAPAPTPNAARLLVGQSPGFKVDLSHLHPAQDQAIGLWRMFVDNVHPLVMIFAAPDKETIVMRAIQEQVRLDSRTDAFLFCVYSMAVLSMSEDACMDLMNETRDCLLQRYQSAAEQALLAAHVLRTTDLVVIQSFLLYLLSMNGQTDPSTMWALTGVLVRLGERLGLHHDGSHQDLTPYETELRRRLWWQMLKLDIRAAELSGCTSVCTTSEWNTQMPSPIDDDALRPDMPWPSSDPSVPGQMMHCLVRFEFLAFYRSLKYPDGTRCGKFWFRSQEISIQGKEAAIDDLEQLLQTKYLQHCDPLRPVHFLSTIIIRVATCTMRLMIHHHHSRREDGTTVPKSKTELLFNLAVKCLDYSVLAFSTELIRCFSWHIENYFQWTPLIVLLTELCDRGSGPQVDRAWELVAKIYAVLPNFVIVARKTLQTAIGDLVLRAWRTREAYLRTQFSELPIPEFVQSLRNHREYKAAHHKMPKPTKEFVAQNPDSTAGLEVPDGWQLHAFPTPKTDHTYSSGSGPEVVYPFEPGITPNTVFSPLNWDQWESLIHEDLQIFG